MKARTLTLMALPCFVGLLLLSAANSAPPGDDDDSKGPKTPIHDLMEDVEDLYNEIKAGRGDVAKYPQLAKTAAKLRPLMEETIKKTPEALKMMGTAKTKPDMLEAEAMMVETLAQVIHLEAALLRKNAEQVKLRLKNLRLLKNNGHDRFQK